LGITNGGEYETCAPSCKCKCKCKIPEEGYEIANVRSQRKAGNEERGKRGEKGRLCARKGYRVGFYKDNRIEGAVTRLQGRIWNQCLKKKVAVKDAPAAKQ
jgi:hypothetical protein